MYRICWKSRLTDVSGHGEYILNHDEAEEWINILTKKYPEIEHWIEPNLSLAIQNVSLK